MSLTRREVENIAHLARLEITADAIPGYVDNLSRIIDFVAQLDAADTGAVEPMAHPLEMVQRRRADELTEANHRDEYQQNAPATESGLYLVPKVIE